MRPIPKELRDKMAADPFYSTCARKSDGGCDGRITWEHCLIFGGRQINEPWAIIGLCEWHHAVGKHQDGGNLLKEKNVWIALNRATDEELANVSKAINYRNMRDRLNKIYGKNQRNMEEKGGNPDIRKSTFRREDCL